MGIVRDRQQVLDVYTDAAQRGWVLAGFNTENLTTTEAILSGAVEVAQAIGCADLPIVIGLTNMYPQRPQAVNYTHTRCWETGLKLFLADIEVLLGSGSAFADLKVLIHLDHIRPDIDRDLLGWDMGRFSSIMYDASSRPIDQNIAATAAFVQEHRDEIVIEAACGQIAEALGQVKSEPTTPDTAERFWRQTGVDLVVADLGTQHRAAAAELEYHAEVARQITERIGPRLVLHGASSIRPEQIANLFADGVRKVNIWTALERDATLALLRDMLTNAAKLVGAEQARQLAADGLLGEAADTKSPASVSHFTTHYRRELVFGRMKKTVADYLQLLYV